jgi:hypothetical protein
MAPGGVEPPHADSKSAALSAELRGRRRPVCQAQPARPGEPPPGGDPRRRYPVSAAVAVAQLVEPRVVVPVVAGSNPVRHPHGKPWKWAFLVSETYAGRGPKRPSW